MRFAPWLLLACVQLASAQPRPQLSPEDAARHRVADYLAQGPAPWTPAALADLGALQPDFIVAADGSGSHRSVQAAVDAVPAAAPGQRRHVILIRPGSYREALCVRDKAPLLLLGSALDAASVRIVDGRYHGQVKARGVAAHPCVPNLDAERIGTGGSTSVAIFSDDVQLAHLTIANDAMDGVRGGVGYPPGVDAGGGAQAVALTTAGDRIQLEGMRLLGHQDTLYARSRPGAAAARVYVRASLIAGDVDFIFGDATLVIDHGTVLSRVGRRAPGMGGHVLAPSTAPRHALGFLVSHSVLLAEPGAAAGTSSLGRAWDQGVAPGTWAPGSSPNGQALVRDSRIGPHIGPWAASTSRRPFAATGEAANRLAEHGNLTP